MHYLQYLAYDSHHPQSVKRGIVNCLYERAKRLVIKLSVIPEEKTICHLFWFLIVILFLSYRNFPRPENQTTVQKCFIRIQNLELSSSCQASEKMYYVRPFPGLLSAFFSFIKS